MKKISIIACVILSVFLTIVFIVLLYVLLYGFSVYPPRQHCTTDIEDYGKYVGNYDNDSVEAFITSFFPEKIEDDFANVKYSYRAQKGDAYAYEAYLEFQIEDEEEFESYILMKTGGKAVEFSYDSDFKEYVISDILDLQTEEGEKTYNIGGAKIGKILYSEKDHRIIYVAIGVYDGGLAKTSFLCEYFNRFNIDPLKYKE